MPIEVLMPALSPTMEKGNLAKWIKSEGDKIKSGDIIAEIETDKATMEVEATDEGTLGKILIPEGTADVAVNTPIAVILSDGEDASSIKAAKAARTDSSPTSPSMLQNRVRRSVRARPQISAPAVAAPKLETADDPDVPAGTEMVTMTVREALRDAMAEEMRRDPDVFVMGEEVAEYQGAYKVTQGLLQEFGADRGHRHADHRTRLCRHGRRRRVVGTKADRRVHDVQLRHAGDRPDHQFGGEDAVHVRWPDGLRDRIPRTERRRGARRRPAQPGLLVVVFARSGPDRDFALQCGGRQGPAQGRDPLSQSGDLPRERTAVRSFVPGAEARRLCAADRPRKDRARRATA